MHLTVVIPTLNEAGTIRKALASVLSESDVEAIVADGGSTDETVALAQGLAHRVIESPAGRAIQMNAGAKGARGEILLFLHADTVLPPGWAVTVRESLSDPGVVGGAFDLEIASASPNLSRIAKIANLRSRLTRVPYGDQAVFVRREVFERLGGYPEIPIMEDVAFGRRLKRAGRLSFLPLAARTSARRWEAEGLIYTTVRNWALVLLFLAGISPERLSRWYRIVRTERRG